MADVSLRFRAAAMVAVGSTDGLFRTKSSYFSWMDDETTKNTAASLGFLFRYFLAHFKMSARERNIMTPKTDHVYL